MRKIRYYLKGIILFVRCTFFGKIAELPQMRRPQSKRNGSTHICIYLFVYMYRIEWIKQAM